MAHEVVMPKMGESIVEGTILDWKKSEGDFIQKDEILLEISTDKVDSEIPSPVEGSIIQILFKKGDTVEVGKVIAIVGDEGESVSVIDKKEESAKQDESSFEKETLGNEDRVKAGLVEHKQIPSQEKNQSNRFYSPLVRKIAHKENISLNQLDSIPGTGLNGRVSKKDVLAYIQGRDNCISEIPENKREEHNPESVKEMSHIQKLVARHMKESINISPHVYSNVEVDVTDIVSFIKNNKDPFLKKYNNKLTYTPIFLEACVECLKEFPLINASIIEDKIKYHQNINIGVAVALEDDSLIVPVIHRAEEKNFLGLVRNTSELAVKARSGGLSADEITGSTFTLTNPGVFGSSFGMAIINQPNVAILSTGAINKKPIVKETKFGDAVFVRSVMNLTLGYDHRIINGAYGSRFLVSVKEYLENFNIKNKI